MFTPVRNPKNSEVLLGASRQYHTKCVCQICTCGTHLCPKPKVSFEGESTNHKEYKPYKIIPSKTPEKPKISKTNHYQPQIMNTSYGRSYKPYKIEQQNKANHTFSGKNQFSPKKTKLFDKTEYNSNYKKYTIANQSKPLQISYKLTPKKFYGATNYQQNYTPQPINAKQAYKTPTKYSKKIPFTAVSTYEQEFKPYPNYFNQNINNMNETPKKTNRPRTAHFQGTTTYHNQFRPYQIKSPNRCPILELPRYPTQCSPGKTHVNYSAEKDNWL